jgi:hypothetical protein
MSVCCSSSLPELHTLTSPQASLSRRRFLRSAALLSAAAGRPVVAPSSMLGAVGRPAPRNRITVGARDDIDVISMATPDHWHAITVTASARAGKDGCGEKPFRHALREGRARVRTLRQYGRVWRTGSWQRSSGNFRFACELVRNR